MKSGEKIKNILALIVLIAIFLFIVGTCTSTKSSFNSSTRGLMISR